MPEAPETTPQEDLKGALETLVRLSNQFAKSPGQGARLQFFITSLEADLSFAMEPNQLVQYPAKS